MVDVAIIGAGGYTGLELIKILLNHPKFNIAYLSTSKGDEKLQNLHPSLNSIFDHDIEKTDPKKISEVAKLAFLALPHKTAMSIAKELLDLGVKVVDLSADYRLELESYEKHYCPHEDKKNLSKSVYGLPEFFKDKIKQTPLVANPGCYPTASLLAILPFVDFLDESFPLFIDAKSGVSGAGKKCSHNTQYNTINENIFAYNPLIHRHQPEIAEKIYHLKKREFDINFVPHLIPATRGQLVDIYTVVKKEFDPISHLREFYKDEKFIRVFDKPVDIKSCVGTNFCDIYAKLDGKKLYINSAIDNLLRGASSQAVVNANIMSGFDDDLGIPKIAYMP